MIEADAHVQAPRMFRAALALGDEHVHAARAVLEGMGAEIVELHGGALGALLGGDGADLDLVIASDEHGGVDALRDCRRRGGTIPFVILAPAIDELLWCAIELRLVSLVSTPCAPETLVAAVRSVRGWTGGGRASA